MKKETMIYSLIKASLFSDESVKKIEVSESEWKEVYTELKDQTIIGVPAEWVFKNIALPEDIRLKWEKRYMGQVTFYYQLLHEQNVLIKLMSDNQIPAVILKGSAAAIYYPQPVMRLMGDVDFLVSEDDYQRAYHIMLENGFELMHEEDHTDYHITMKKGKFIYELHREPSGMPDGEEGEYLRKLLSEGMKVLDTVQLEGYEIPILPSLQNGIILLLHINSHLKNGLGMRQILDWMLYVNQELHDDNWYQVMQPVLQNTRFEKLAKSVTKMCQIYLGLNCEDITWCDDVDESVCEKLINYIMEQGNFGRKVKNEDHGVRLLGKTRNPIQLLRLMQERGKLNWKALERYPILRPFAWLYTGCKYIQKSSRGESAIKKITNDIQEGNELRDLYQNLGL